MKVLQVNCVYRNGSTGKITYDLHKGLQEAGIESVVCYGRGKLVNEPGVYKTCPEWYSKLNNAISRITGVMYGGCFFSTNKLISIIKREKPDVVHLQCINGYFVNIYRLINWLKMNQIKTVLTLHAEFMYTANCGHALECERWKSGCGYCPRRRSETKSIFFDGTARSWLKMKKAFAGFDDGLIVISVSPWLSNRAEKAPILKGKKHYVIYNGLDTNVFYPYETFDLRKKYGGEKQNIIFHATPFFSVEKNHLKGGWYICELAKLMPDVLFLVAGQHDKGVSVPQNVILLGRIFDQNLLAKYYSMADATIIVSKKETFSMIVAESLCAGTPVVGFKAGAPEQIALKKYSEFVEYGDINGLYTLIKKYMQVNYEKESIAEEASSKYSKIEVFKEYERIYKKLME